MADSLPPSHMPEGYGWGPAPEAPPPPPPAMVPTGTGYSWRPDGGSSPPIAPASIHHTPARNQQRRGGLAGGILAALAGLFKYGFLLLKFGKLSGTFISFGLSLLIYIGLFGWHVGLRSEERRGGKECRARG